MNSIRSDSKWVVWIPVIFFLFIFLADKLLLIPAVRKCCSKNRIEYFYEDSLNDKMPDLDKMKQAKDSGRKIAVNFGSSMSFGYYYLDQSDESYRKQNPAPGDLVVAKSSARPGKWYVLNLAYPNATAITHFVRFHQLLNRGIKPDLVLIEFSPATFNSGSPVLDDEIRNAMPTGFALRHGLQVPVAHLWTNLSSRLIQSLRYKPGTPDKNLDRYIGRFQNHFRISDLDRKINKPVSYSPGEESPARKSVDLLQLHEMQKLFQFYKPDDNLVKYIKLIVNYTREEGIPLILWNPRIHPKAESIVYSKKNTSEWNKLVKDVTKSGAIYIDFNDPDAMRCNRFIDTFHLGVSCFSELFYNQLRSIDQANSQNMNWHDK